MEELKSLDTQNKLIKILVILDSPKEAEFLRQTLMGLPAVRFELTHVRNYDETLKVLDQESFDAILLDLSLQGFESFVKVRSRILKIPIVVLTGLEDEKLALRAVQEGAQDYLIKQNVNGSVISRVILYAIERNRLLQELRDLTLMDELTGVYNRRGFNVLANQVLKLANRIKKKVLLIYADLDGMKWINDTLGQHEGDVALKQTANILSESFRESDLIARVGGDEFAVLAIETSDGYTEMLKTRLRENLESQNGRKNRRYNLALSIGVAHYDPKQPSGMEELLAMASQLMHTEKRGKTNT